MFNLTIVTPTKTLVDGLAMDEVLVPAFRGELNIFPGHSPLVTTLNEGALRYKISGESEEKVVAISWGYCEVSPLGVSILAETAETPAEIDVERAKGSLVSAEKELLRNDSTPEDIAKYHHKRRRAEARIEVGSQAGK